MKIIISIACAATLVFAGMAHAAQKCSVPSAEWQPREALASKLKALGWDVRSIKTEDGCYEAYAVDAKGHKVEAYFNPKTLERVAADQQDAS